MNKKSGLAVSIAMVSLLTSSTSGATKAEWWQGCKLYVGADVQVRRMEFKEGYGDNLFPHHSPQRNLYAGIRLNDWIGVEGGYETTRTRTSDVTLTTGYVAAGAVILAAASPAVFRSSVKTQGPHVDLVGFYSLREDLPIQLIGSVGLSFFKGTFERRCVSMSYPPIPGRVRTFSKRKAVLRIMGGLEYKWDSHFGTRATIGLVKTGKIVILANDGLPGFTSKIKLKDSIVYGVGIFWVF